MTSKPSDLIPLLRAPLMFTSTLGLILASVSASVTEGRWRWNGEIHRIMCAVVAFYAFSMVSTAAFAYIDHRRGSIRLPKSGNMFSSMLRVMVDSLLAVALLALHIDVSVNAADDGVVILHMYAGMAALPACIFHAVLALHTLVTAIRARQLTKTYCPTCSQRLRRCHSPDLHGEIEEGQSSIRVESKEDSTAAGKGSTEGDRLIITMRDDE